MACRKIPIIGIDGFCLAGKTFLARQLSEVLPAGLVSTDDHIVRRGGRLRYPDRIDLEALSDSLLRARDADRQVVLEGICLLEVIARLRISRSSVCSVYVKRLSRNSGLWHDGFDLEEFEPTASASIPEPHVSVFRYHKRFRPHRSADFEYRRTDRS